MNNREDYYDFLKEISSKNIANVKANFQFAFNNYKTFYIVDTYDIIEFCFPFIFNTNFTFNSQRAITNYLSYQFFFFESANRPIIMDEYRVEIYTFWYGLRNKISEFSNYENLKEGLITKYNEAVTQKDKILFIQNNIGVLLSIAFGTLSKTPIDRYNMLISEGLQNEDISILDKDDQRIVEDIFTETKPDMEKVNASFDRFCESMITILYGKTEEEKYSYLENSYRDIKVYDRLININRKLIHAQSENRLKQKYNFLYLSSAKRKSHEIESYYLDEIPVYDGIVNESLLRTNLDTYLFQLLKIGEGEPYKDQIISFLEKLENVSKTLSKKAKPIEEYRQLFLNEGAPISDTLLSKRSDFDELFLNYHSINKYYDKINDAIKKLRNTNNDDDLFEQFLIILNMAGEDENKEALSQIEDTLDFYAEDIGLKAEIIDNVKFLQNLERGLHINNYPGKDTIRSIIQSFPVLLFYTKSDIGPIQDFFAQIIKPGSEKTEIISKFLHPNHHVLRKFSTAEKKLFFLFIRYLFDKSQTEEILINEIEELIILNKKGKISSEFIAKKMINKYTEDKKFYAELIYIKAWLLRRSNRHDEAIKLINLEEARTIGVDIRLIQCRGLCYKNKFYKEIDMESAFVLKDILISALEDFYKCESSYEEFLINNPNNTLVKQTLFAVSNSIVDSYTNLYFIDSKAFSSEILKCRKRIDDLKIKIKDLGFIYEMYPTFGHTEVDLEYCEAQIFCENGELSKAADKLREANIRLNYIDEATTLDDYEPLAKSRRNIKKLTTTIARRLQNETNL